LLRHIAVAERFVWAETLQGHKSRYTTHGKELADGYENAQFSDEDLQRKCKTPDDAESKKWKWLRLMVEHEIHHRGRFISVSECSACPLRRRTG
jgi:uncharacterized damage-inducible protein DinB